MYVSLSEAKDVAVLMRERLLVDYPSFSMPFFRRRLAYACEKLNVRKVSQLVEMLQQDDFSNQLSYHMAVPASEMFRDPGFWRAIRQLLSHRVVNKTYKVWFPDSSSGDELFSFLIIADLLGISKQLEVTVYHPSEVIIEEQKRGSLPMKAMRLHLSNFERLEGKGELESYFSVSDKFMVLKPSLLSNVRFEVKWFFESKQHESYDFIFFRNSALVLNRQLQEQCLDLLVDKLRPGGLLCLGIQEHVSEVSLERLRSINDDEKIFEKYII